MGYKTLELTVISAQDLKKVNLIEKMDLYAAILLSGDPKYRYSKQKTSLDVGGGSNPNWNHTVAFMVDESSLARLMVVLRLRRKRTFRWDKDVGHVRVWVDYLLHKKDQPTFSYQVRTPSDKYQGRFDFSFKLSYSDWTPPPVVYAPPPIHDHHHHHHGDHGWDGDRRRRTWRDCG